jgi:hypothetical protein
LIKSDNKMKCDDTTAELCREDLIHEVMSLFTIPREITKENLAYGRFEHYINKLDNKQLMSVIDNLKSGPMMYQDNISVMAAMREQFGNLK